MRKYLVLFLVVVFVGVKGSLPALGTEFKLTMPVGGQASLERNLLTIESNAETKEIAWIAGDSVNATLGPEDAVYCRLKDPKRRTVFDGFGPCRIMVDRVTPDHQGNWEIISGNPGSIFFRYNWIRINVITLVPSTLVVEPSVVRNGSSVILTCSLHTMAQQVKRCTFRDPFGTIFIATSEVTRDANETHLTRYETLAADNFCRLTLLKPHHDIAGHWRCAVDTAMRTDYGFLHVASEMLDTSLPVGPRSLPTLESNYHSTSAFEGDTVPMSCSINSVIRYCYFRAPNGTIYNVGPSTSTAEYEYIGNGFEAGDCGIKFNSITKSSEGRWRCTVGASSEYSFSYFESSDAFNVYVIERLAVYQRWEGNRAVISMRFTNFDALPKVEYCRFVRSDGLSFVTGREPAYYYITSPDQFTCKLSLLNPVAEDIGRWVVAGKVAGEDEEMIATINLEPRQIWSRSSNFTVFWCFFGTLIMLLILASCLPKKNREWTHQRAVRIRNSFRRQPHPQPQQQNVADVPVVHTDILTDLPRKV